MTAHVGFTLCTSHVGPASAGRSTAFLNSTISTRSQWQNDACAPAAVGCGRAQTVRLLSLRRTLLQSGCWLACLVTLLHSVAWAEWTVKRLYSQTGTLERCMLESNTAFVSDGYQETQVSMMVSADTITVKTKAPPNVATQRA